jgi:hypothetical protein
MLIIKENQMMIGISEEEGFVNWYINEFMPECLPIFHKAFNTEELLEMISTGRRIAIQYDFNNPVCQTHFITFMWEIGANFYQQPGFKEIIKEVDSLEDVKINKFYTEISENKKNNAIDKSNDWSWFSKIETK